MYPLRMSRDEDARGACGGPGIPWGERRIVTKVAAPGKDGGHSELNTYGYACPAHVEEVVADAEGRARAYRFAPGESVGRIGAFPLADAGTRALTPVLASR
ncbi:MAG: hypothetical protein JO116_04290 [Planctomycetaceae bacterium]|nr:hypothetical protein [Planctomycetaceae bacterium]